ncbi:MAG: triose-phosphate isomerase [Crenarchaeota archaeon 13_1_40CM_3_52_10]|nr:MAG: triose-phosphate isomerase [Crenarchaeota archaeon 13_1_40CM_3_52_10]
MERIRTPLILVNFKTYIEATGKRGVELAKIADQVSRDSGVTIAVAPQFTDLKTVTEAVEIPVFSQHIDPIKPGAYTGHVLAEAVKAAGASATLLNHSERRIKISEIEEVLSLARISDLVTLVCTDTPGVSAAVASLNPDMIAIEPPDLIGTGVAVSKARPELITNAIRRIRSVNNSVDILCGAGVTTAEDVGKALELGTRGVLVSSSVVKGTNPGQLLENMTDEVLRSK